MRSGTETTHKLSDRESNGVFSTTAPWAQLTLGDAVQVLKELVDPHLRKLLELRVPPHLLQHGVELRRVLSMVPKMMQLGNRQEHPSYKQKGRRGVWEGS